MTAMTEAWLSEHLAEIDRVASVPDIIALIKRIDALKVALESVDRFHDQSVKYAQLEAAALIRAVGIGGVTAIPTKHRNTAEWLYYLSPTERENFISMCAEGLTIDQIYKREVGNDLKLHEKIETMLRRRKEIINKVRETGIVDISSFSNEAREYFKGSNSAFAEDVIDGTRNALRRIGAVGVGEDSIYVMPCAKTKDSVEQAILMRYESAMNDMEKIVHIAHAANLKMSWRDFGIDVYHADRSGHGFLVSFVIGLSHAGVISDYDSFMKEVASSDLYAEIAWVQKKTAAAKKDCVRLMYEREFGEEPQP